MVSELGQIERAQRAVLPQAREQVQISETETAIEIRLDPIVHDGTITSSQSSACRFLSASGW